MIYLLYLLLALGAFLVVLNGFLRGSRKAQIDALLSVLLVSLLIIAFVAYGWKVGLIAISVTFFFALASRPLAARAAAKLFALPSGISGSFPGLPPRALARICGELAGGGRDPNETIQDLLSGGGTQRQAAEDALFDYCEASGGVRQVMDEFGVSRATLKELYSTLLAAGAGQWAGGHWVAASTLAYPETLRYVLEGRANGRNGRETAFSLIMHFERGTPLLFGSETKSG
jgi:hypothetical protein